MRSLAPVLLLLSLPSWAQTGPGGIGNSTTNILWLRADQGVLAPTLGVQQWTDGSGNGNHAVQTNGARQPTLATNVMNGYPAVLFDNDQTNADRLMIPDNATLEGMNGLSAFAVYRLNAGTATSAPRGILSKRNDPSSQNAYGWFLWDNGGNLRQHLDVDGSGERLIGTVNRATGTAYLDAFVYHGAAPSNANDLTLFTGHAAESNRQETSTSIPNYTSDLYIGSLYGHTGSGANTTRFNGHIAEVIMFNQALGAVQRLIISNYLAAKYGLALGTEDIYVQDLPGNGDHDHDVAGIGRISSANLQTDSRGTGIVRINNATGLGDNEFLIWGHDNRDMDAWGVTDFPPSIQGRVARVWRVSEVSTAGAAVDVGNVDITFDLAGLGPVSAGDLRLLVDTDNDGLFADETPISGATNTSGSLYRFAGVSALANNRRFTIGTANAFGTPLPIELVSFGAALEDVSVRLRWTTASELNNAFFTVERSIDMATWSPVAEVPGAINSTAMLHYSTLDGTPPSGAVFYRLRQTDLDGTSTVGEVVSVLVEPAAVDELIVFPNPVQGPVTITLNGAPPGPVDITLFDMNGRPVQRNALVLDERRYRLDLEDLPRGAYLLQVRHGNELKVARLIR